MPPVPLYEITIIIQVDALGLALQKNPRLQVHLQLDLNRSTRPGASSTARLLLPLLRAYPNRVKVHLFRSPSLRGLLAKIVPPRFNEGWGTWHAKIYGADSDLIISGYVPATTNYPMPDPSACLEQT